MAPSSDFSPSCRPMTPTLSSQYSLQNPRIQGVFQSIVKDRKSWKILRGGEAIWPPELEAALIEGLENYQPEESRETLLLGRFPMRNKFLSDWIFEKTGKRRTAKQIGSRLQQFRDTPRGKRLLTLLSPTRCPCRPDFLYPESHDDDSHLLHGPPPPRCEPDLGSDPPTSPATPTGVHATLQDLLYRGVASREEKTPTTIVYVDLLRPDFSISVNSTLTSGTSPTQAAEECSWVERGYRIVRATQYPRHLHEIDPTITLLSHSMTDARSCFTVYSEDRLIFSESTILEPVDPTASNVDGILYKTSLVPGLWSTISQSSDASQYTIIQHVIQGSSPSSPSVTSRAIFSAIYKFLYRTSSPMEQNFSIPHILTTETLVQNDNFSLEGLLSIKADVYPDIMAFAKSHNIFDLDFTLRLDSWSAQCSTAQSVSVFPIPSYDSQSIQNNMFDEEQVLSLESFLNGINYL